MKPLTLQDFAPTFGKEILLADMAPKAAKQSKKTPSDGAASAAPSEGTICSLFRFQITT